MKRFNVVVVGVALVLSACGGRGQNYANAVPDARALLSQGRTGEARILLKNALAQGKPLPEARALLGELALQEGDAKAASDELSTLDAATADTPEVLALRIRIAIALGRNDQADELLKNAGDRIAEPQRSVLQAQVLRGRGASADALQVLRRLQGQRADDVTVSVEIARTLAAMGNLTSAMGELDRFIAAHATPSPEALRERGDLRMRQGDTAGAIKDLDAALAAAPPDWPTVERLAAELMKAQSLIASGSVDDARKLLEKVEKASPGSFGAVVLRAQLALIEGRPGEAVDRLTPVVDAVPGDERLQGMLIDALIRSGNFVRATELLEKRVAIDPTNAGARQDLARLMMQQGRPDRVVELLGGDDAARATTTETGGVNELLAGARQAQSRARTAIATLGAQVAAAPDDAGLRAQLAAAQLAGGDPALALGTLGAAGPRAPLPLAAATRITALLAMGNEFESNRFVNGLLDPDAGAKSDVLIAAADAALSRRDSSAASRLLDRAAQIDATNGEVVLRRASLAFDAKRYEEAERLLKSIPENGPAALQTRIALARVAEERGDLDGARASLKAAIKARPPAVEAAMMLAGLEIRANRPAQVAEVLDQLAAVTTDGGGANAAGVLLARNGRFEEARARFRQALEQKPDEPEYLRNLGQAQLALGDRGAAQENLVSSALLDRENLITGQMAVRLSLELKDVARARTVADSLVKALPASAGSWFSAGQVSLAEGKYDAARADFAKAQALRPTASAARGEFGARVALRLPRAEEPLLNWLAREPRDLATRRVLGDYYLGTNQLPQARQQLETLVTQAPSDAGSLNNLAWLLRTSEPPRAEKLARQAAAIAPDNAAIGDTLGAILLANGKTDEAVTALAAAAGRTADPNVQFHYAQALQAAGRGPEARVVVRKALDGQAAFAERAAAQRLAEVLK